MVLKKMMVAASIATVLGTTAVTAAFAADTAKTDLLANVDHVQWLDVNRLIASQDTDSGRVDYLVDVNTGKFEKLLDAQNASELVLSSDESKAAYTDSTGAVYVLDLATKTTKQVSADTAIKPELVWSVDGNSLYFLNTDSANAVKKLNIADGTIATVLDDKKNYKANLNVSTNSNILTYTLTVTPAVTAPSPSNQTDVDKDDVTIDATAAATDVFNYNVSAGDNKPVQLTKTTDDKVFVGTNANGNESYFVKVSSDANTKSSLVAVSSSGVEKALYNEQDVYQAKYAGGLLYVLTSGSAGKNQISVVSPVGTSNLLYTVPDATTDIEVSKSGLVAIEMDGKTYVDKNGQWVAVTQ